MWLFPHTCTYSHTYRWSVSHHSGSCTLTSRISIMEFVMSWSLLQLEVILAWDSWQTFCFNPAVLARGNKMPTMTTSAASCRGCFHPVNGFHFNAFYCLNFKMKQDPLVADSSSRTKSTKFHWEAAGCYSGCAGLNMLAFNCISFHKFSWQPPTFSLCSSGLISALLVHSAIYLFMKASLSPDIILCGWLGLKHQITNY